MNRLRKLFAFAYLLTAAALNMSARWVMDLSPGTCTLPEARRAGRTSEASMGARSIIAL